MVPLKEFEAYLEQLLEPGRFDDYCPNGLQVEGRGQIAKVIGGVSACQGLLDVAVEEGADAVLVHHGYFWKGEDARIIGIKRRRLRTLLANGINLFAYHLPLDAHPELGNNVRLADRLGLVVDGSLADSGQGGLVLTGRLPAPMKGAELAQLIAERLGREPLHIGEPDERIETLAWCTGAAQSFIELAMAAGVDAYITGEVSEPTVHTAREAGIHFYAAGHHATERYGVQALGSHLQQHFGIEFSFVDIANPV
jgi:dinuclear metal center YbgI/SA1388 family protein